MTKARETAEEKSLDLVEVAPQARPPVVKLMDWGKYDHDFNTKLKRARGFLDEGNVVRVVLRFRGRELRRPEVGHAQLDKMLEATEDIARVEHRSRNIEGRRLIAILEPMSNS